MAVRPRIRTTQPLAEADESTVSAIINRGGAPAGAEVPVPPPQPAPVFQALPPVPPILEPPVVAPPAPALVSALPPALPPPVPLSQTALSPAPLPDANAEKKFTLRLPASLLAAIEKDAKDRPDRISVNTWLIGAALQRLTRVG